MLQLQHHQRRGRGLYTTRKVLAGETVLQEDPMLLIVAQTMAQQACASCLRLVTPQLSSSMSCSTCKQSCFCSTACHTFATTHPEVHGDQICRGYAALAATTSLTPEELDQGRFVLHALQLRNLHLVSADPRYSKLLQLEGQPTGSDLAAAAHIGVVLEPILSSASPDTSAQTQVIPLGVEHAEPSPACSTGSVTTVAAVGSPPSLEEVATLLRKEQFNSYGILGPHGARGERRLRGSAVYIEASMVNHECTPTAARFDSFDSGVACSTRVSFRALHDLPEGTEVTQSYCPLNWSYADRQQQCSDVYGFSCRCSRCQTESAWPDAESGSWETDSSCCSQMEDEEEEQAEADQAIASLTSRHPVAADSMDVGGASAFSAGVQAVDVSSASHMQNGSVPKEDVPNTWGLPVNSAPDDPPYEDTYVHLYLLKYLCPVPECFGTLAPTEPGSTSSECNVCGALRTDAQFLEDLDRDQAM